MSVEWQAPCGCIIEFMGQTVDKGEQIKVHKHKCARHPHPDHSQAADAAFDDCKFRERVRFTMNADGSFTSEQFDLVYDATGPLQLIVHKTLNNQQKSQLESKIAASFGAEVVITYG